MSWVLLETTTVTSKQMVFISTQGFSEVFMVSECCTFTVFYSYIFNSTNSRVQNKGFLSCVNLLKVIFPFILKKEVYNFNVYEVLLFIAIVWYWFSMMWLGNIITCIFIAMVHSIGTLLKRCFALPFKSSGLIWLKKIYNNHTKAAFIWLRIL